MGKDPLTRCDYCARKLHVSQVRWDWKNLLACDRCFDPYPVVLDPPLIIKGELSAVDKGKPDYLSDEHPIL